MKNKLLFYFIILLNLLVLKAKGQDRNYIAYANSAEEFQQLMEKETKLALANMNASQRNGFFQELVTGAKLFFYSQDNTIKAKSAAFQNTTGIALYSNFQLDDPNFLSGLLNHPQSFLNPSSEVTSNAGISVLHSDTLSNLSFEFKDVNGTFSTAGIDVQKVESTANTFLQNNPMMDAKTRVDSAYGLALSYIEDQMSGSNTQMSAAQVQEFLKAAEWSTDCATQNFSLAVVWSAASFYNAVINTALCYTAKNQCQNSSAPTQFTYGFFNAVVSSLNISEILTGLGGMLKSMGTNIGTCMLKGGVAPAMMRANDVSGQIYAISNCVFGIDITSSDFKTKWNEVSQWVQNNYTDPYVQGQAAGFIATMIIGNYVFKALSASNVALAEKQIAQAAAATDGLANDASAFSSIANASDDAVELENAIKNIEAGNTASTIKTFKVGSQFSSFTVKQLRNGTNGKYAIIGRQMTGFVDDAQVALSSQVSGEVEAFNTASQQSNIFNINGKNYTWGDLTNDLKTGNYKRDPATGFVLESDVQNTLMFQANKVWTNKIVNSGYTILDIGYPANITSQSAFYNMELSIIF